MPNALMFIINESKRYAALPYVESGTNHQKFSDIVNAYGLAGCQNQAWCATYQFALELLAFGKADALSHWCMTDKNYCGYNVFSTRDKFKAKNRTGSTPKLGALVIFNRSHMGRVIAVDNEKKTFQCAEGNTSNKEFNRDGDACAIKTYAFNDAGIDCFCYIDYGDWTLTRIKVIKAYRAVYEMAHNLKWKYGDSHSTPPCIGDNTISCDRMISLAFWILGYTDQPAGGIVVAAGTKYMEAYLTRWGLKKNTDPNKCKRGDVVMFRNSSPLPNANWHAFGLTEFTNVNNVKKYDMGSQARIDSAQPFSCPLNQWEGQRWFYASFQIEENNVKDFYETNPSELKAGTENNSAYMASVILKARGYKGVIDSATGKQKELELNFKHTTGDMVAASQYVTDRMKNWVRIDVKAGEVNRALWQDLLGGSLPFRLYELPRCQTNGLSVLFWQEQMRARGIKDDDGNEIGLDRQWGEKTASTVRKYCKAVGLKERDIVDYEVWQSVCGGV